MRQRLKIHIFPLPYIFFIPVVILFFTSCDLTYTPYTRKDLPKLIKEICKDEFKIDVKSWIVDDTIWVYAPLDIVGEDYNLKWNSNIEKKEEDDELYQQIRRINQAILRSSLNVDNPPLFYVFVYSDINKMGIDIYNVGMVIDFIKGRFWYLSGNDLDRRIVSISDFNPVILNDKEGKHLSPYKMTIQEYFSLLITQNILRTFLDKKNKDYFTINDIDVKIEGETLIIKYDIFKNEYKEGLPDIEEKIQEITNKFIDAYSNFIDIKKVEMYNITLREKNEWKTEISGNNNNTSPISTQSTPYITYIYKKNIYSYLIDRYLYKKNDFDKAEKLVTYVMENFPSKDMRNFGYKKLGEIYTYKEDYDKAINYFKRALEILPNEYSTYYLLGTIYYDIFLWKSFNMEKESIQKTAATQALKYFSQSFELNPNYPYTLLQLSFMYIELGNYDKARQYFKRLGNNKNRRIKSRLSWGKTFMTHSQIDRDNLLDNLITMIEKELEKEPKSPYWNSFLGDVYFYKKDYQQAIKYYKKALKYNEEEDTDNIDRVDILSKIGEAYYNKADIGTAISYYEKSAVLAKEQDRLFSFFRIYCTLGRIYYSQNNRDYIEARNYFKDAEKIYPQSPLINSLLGEVYYYLKRDSFAIEYFNKALLYNPEYTYVYYMLGILYSSKRKYQEAELNLLKAKSLALKKENYDLVRQINDILKRIEILKDIDNSSQGSNY